jgi:glycosyltransferase involved in cell wall biosynthesis
MKALVIAPQPFFSYRGTPFSVYYRTLITAEFGVQVDLLTYGQGQDVNIPGVRVIRIPGFKFLGAVKIGPSWLKLFFDIFITIWAIFLLSTNKYKFVQAHEEAGFICWFLKPIFKFKLIYDMHSSLPEQLTNFKFTKLALVVKFFRFLEHACLRSADVTITICPSLYSYACQIVGSNQLVTLIENSIFEEVHLQPESYSQQSLNELAIAHPFVIYAGTLEPYQGLDVLIRAFQTVLAERPDLHLLIVGGTEEQVRYYTNLAEEIGLAQHCIFTGNVAPTVARQYANRAVVQISCRVSGTNVPLKVYEMLARRVPIVATDIYSHTQVLNEDVAFLVKPEPLPMAHGILTALKPNGDSKRRVVNAYHLYERKYSRRIYKDKMKFVLDYLDAGKQSVTPLAFEKIK